MRACAKRRWRRRGACPGSTALQETYSAAAPYTPHGGGGQGPERPQQHAARDAARAGAAPRRPPRHNNRRGWNGLGGGGEGASGREHAGAGGQQRLQPPPCPAPDPHQVQSSSSVEKRRLMGGGSFEPMKSNEAPMPTAQMMSCRWGVREAGWCVCVWWWVGGRNTWIQEMRAAGRGRLRRRPGPQRQRGTPPVARKRPAVLPALRHGGGGPGLVEHVRPGLKMLKPCNPRIQTPGPKPRNGQHPHHGAQAAPAGASCDAAWFKHALTAAFKPQTPKGSNPQTPSAPPWSAAAPAGAS